MTIRAWPTLTALVFCGCLLSWVSPMKGQNPTCIDYSKDPAGCQPSTFDTPLDKMPSVRVNREGRVDPTSSEEDARAGAAKLEQELHLFRNFEHLHWVLTVPSVRDAGREPGVEAISMVAAMAAVLASRAIAFTSGTGMVVVAGKKATLLFKISHPSFDAVIQKFEVVHDREYHLFVISQDMEYFQHIHPEESSDGTWSIEVTLPKSGYYKVLSDFLPAGGSTQFIARPLVTAGYAGDLAADSAHLVPDTVHKKTVDELTAEVSFDPPTFVAGLYGHLTFHLTDTATGRPITDLQTYLGAFGHTLIMSEDMGDYVHSHPLDISTVSDESGPKQFMLPASVDPETLRGGTEVTFEGLMPRPGRYRAWTQFRRNNKLHTFATTFSVAAGE